jgi:hypothetical protein
MHEPKPFETVYITLISKHLQIQEYPIIITIHVETNNSLIN